MKYLALIALAFGAGLAVLSLGGGGAPAPAAVQRPVLRGGGADDVATLQRAVRSGRDDLRPTLAAAYLQRVRDTGDPSFYTRAEGVLRTPRTPDGFATAGELALARHDFRGALELGRRAGRIGSFVRVDALVELGRYDEAERELQVMIDRKPNLAAYARVSYLRELRGDLEAAAEAMRFAAAAGGPAAENRAYVLALLGELQRRLGKPGAAKRAFGEALALVPRFAAAEAGLARLDAGDRNLTAAIGRLSAVTERLPLSEHVVALGEAQLAAGRTAEGRETLALVAAQQELQRTAGVDVDVELAVYEADHGSAQRAVELARRGWKQAPSVRSADALGWALTRSGKPREGLTWARRALALGSVDPIWRAHTGLSALAAGRVEEGRKQLRIALRHGLDGFPWQAQRVRRALR